MGKTNVMYFLSDFDNDANFGSREINIKAYTRIINGKAIPVKGARRTVLAIRDALNDLRKITRDNNEGAYLMNPSTGKVGQYVQGGKDVVSPFDNMYHTPKGDQYNPKIGKNRYILHNHPNTSSLSIVDFMGSDKLTFATNNNGSIFRGKMRKDLEFDKRFFEPNFEEVDNNIKWIYENSPYAPTNPDKADFLTSHIRNIVASDEGFVDYKYKLKGADKELVDAFSTTIKKIRTAYKARDLETSLTKLINDPDLWMAYT